jgi:hypothetical protein
MALLEVVLHADHRLQYPELLVLLVLVTPVVRARELGLLAHLAAHPVWLGQGLRGLVLVPVHPHARPQICVAHEPFPTYVTEVNVLGQ